MGVFAALFLLLQGVNYWLARYRTLQSQDGSWAGALYTDVHAVIPTSAILAVTAVIVAILFVFLGAGAAFYSIYRRVMAGSRK